MELDYYSLAKAGLTEEEIQDVLSRQDQGDQIKTLKKNRGRLMEDIHRKQQCLDTIDYMISKIGKHA